MKNKLIALLTMSALAVGTLAGCGNTAATDTAASAADTAAEPTVEAVSTAADEAADTSADSADKYADLSGSVSMSGSTSMEKLANAVAESFMEKYPNVTVTAEFTGSSAGIESVLAGSVDIGNSSRNLKDDEKSAGGMPCFVKPAADGSSFGVSKVKNADQLAPALRVAFMESNELMIEGFLDGTEISQGIYKTAEKTVVLPAGQSNAQRTETERREALKSGLFQRSPTDTGLRSVR